MSQSFQQGFYNFSSVYERSVTKHEDMLRVQGFEPVLPPPPPQQVEEPPGAVYDGGGMLTEIISATEILDDQIQSSNYRPWPQKEQQQQLPPAINEAEVINW